MNALITGSSSDIGKTINKELENANYKILPFNLRLENFEGVEKEAREISKKYDVNLLI